MEKDGELVVTEIKYNENKIVKLPGIFEQTYKPKKFTVINRANYIDGLYFTRQFLISSMVRRETYAYTVKIYAMNCDR